MKDRSVYIDAPAYCHYYFDLVETNDLLAELQRSRQLTQELILSIPPEMENYAYEEGKWTIREILRHIVDCERVYTYRALRFSRFDNTDLPGFDEQDYIIRAKNTGYGLADLLTEYSEVRNSTVSLFKFMTDEMLDFKGTANKFTFTARAFGFMTIGHNIHHCGFLRAKYLGREK